jgi:hypothetical protein
MNQERTGLFTRELDTESFTKKINENAMFVTCSMRVKMGGINR